MKRMLLALALLGTYASQAQEKTPLTLTEDEKQYGLAQIWGAAKQNFVYYDQLKFSWDSLYKATIPKVREAKDARAYYDVLRWFAAQLNDGHTGVWYPMSFYNPKAMYPVLETDKIEGRVFITTVMNDTLTQQGIEKGMEILKINGMDVIQYAEKYIAPYESASSSIGLEKMVYTHSLLMGPLDEPVRLTLKDKKGQVKEYNFSRRMERRVEPIVQYSVVGKNIGLLKIDGFDSKGFNKKFDSLYAHILKTDALIIDLRENGGGDGIQGRYIMKHIMKTPFKEALSSGIQYNPLLKAWGMRETPFLQFPASEFTPFKDRTIYEKPVVLLIGKSSYSAAEDFAMSFDYAKRGVIIGEPTGGSTGQPMFFDLPGGGTLRVCIKKDTYPDGKPFVGIGIQPTIPVQQTVKSFLKGEDVVLQKALEILK
jgi:C-terminal processing protease CtpA/Prc